MPRWSSELGPRARMAWSLDCWPDPVAMGRLSSPGGTAQRHLRREIWISVRVGLFRNHPMYLRQLRVGGLKRLHGFTLDVTHRGKPRMWTVLIGENGTAKTTLLQAIALAAAGSKQVNTLVGPIVRHLRDRRTDTPMSIEARFEFTPSSLVSADAHPHLQGDKAGLRLLSKVTLEPGSTSLDAHATYTREGGQQVDPNSSKDPLDAARDVHRPLWFVAGYGVSRGLPNAVTEPSLDRPSIDRLAPLFNNQALLASTSFSNYFLKIDAQAGRSKGETSRVYGRMLNDAVQLGGRELLPDIEKIELRGRGGVGRAADLIESDRFHQRMGSGVHKIPGVALSHGYQSTFAWIADLIGHVFLESRGGIPTTDMEGLVLLDEIDLYLHPSWQATFIRALRRVFPKIQFIATTHSPVVLGELAPHEVVRLIIDRETGNVARGAWDPETGELVPTDNGRTEQPDPRPMTGSEIYRTWFGMDRLTPNPSGEDLREYLVLAGDCLLYTSPSPRDGLLSRMPSSA